MEDLFAITQFATIIERTIKPLVPVNASPNLVIIVLVKYNNVMNSL